MRLFIEIVLFHLLILSPLLFLIIPDYIVDRKIKNIWEQK